MKKTTPEIIRGSFLIPEENRESIKNEHLSELVKYVKQWYNIENSGSGEMSTAEVLMCLRYLSYMVFILLMITIIFLCVGYIIDEIRKAKFVEAYGLFKIPKKVTVRKNKYQIKNSFYVDPPKWLHENRDGTRDKRWNDNKIVENYSVLYIDDFCVISKDARAIIFLVYDIRKRYGVSYIEKNELEQEKYDDALRMKKIKSAQQNFEQLQQLFMNSPTEFEKYIADIYKQKGYKVHVTPKTNDGGYDIEMSKDHEKTLVECKCFNPSNKIGRPAIQKLVGANEVARANNLIFVTTSVFSKEAQEYAKQTNVTLIDGIKLQKLAGENSASHQKYISLDDWQLNAKDVVKMMSLDISKVYRYRRWAKKLKYEQY